MSQNQWLSEFDTYRHKNLVYLRTLKCGSTYYANAFKNVGWIKSTADTINWDTDHVFSFIMDPYERRLKGLTEFVFANRQLDLLQFDKIFWGGVLYLDMHAIPYNISYGKYIDKIDWIPIDCKNFDKDIAVTMLKSLLAKYELHYEFPLAKEHESSEDKLKIYQLIKEKTSNGNYAIHIGLESDINLYHRVCTKISPWLLTTDPWPSISWLK